MIQLWREFHERMHSNNRLLRDVQVRVTRRISTHRVSLQRLNQSLLVVVVSTEDRTAEREIELERKQKALKRLNLKREAPRLLEPR